MTATGAAVRMVTEVPEVMEVMAVQLEVTVPVAVMEIEAVMEIPTDQVVAQGVGVHTTPHIHHYLNKEEEGEFYFSIFMIHLN